MNDITAGSESHPFIKNPHKTILWLSFPVLLSLIAEPLTGLVDTAFIASLGTEPLAALGVGTTVLSSIFWIFNFLGIGAQTEVAQASGQEDIDRSVRISTLGIVLSLVFGILIMGIGMPLTATITSLLGASGALQEQAIIYVSIRWYGSPAVLIMLTVFGTLRGLQEMKMPLWIAVGINVLNLCLDPLLIFGYGPVPAFGIAGAATASVISQWTGAIWAMMVVYKRLGITYDIPIKDTIRLLKIGGDLFVRTGLLNLFFIMTTRTATRIGAESGATHQAIRQVWLFTTLILDAYAITGQSLVAYFFGPENIQIARRVAKVVCIWSVITGVILGVLMWFGTDLVMTLLVPPAAIPYFFLPWLLVVLLQPVNALAFATDGIHWGTGDFRYLRNVVMVATGIGVVGIYLIDETHTDALALVWAVSTLWISIRAALGVVRIWPGMTDSPLKIMNPV